MPSWANHVSFQARVSSRVRRGDIGPRIRFSEILYVMCIAQCQVCRGSINMSDLERSMWSVQGRTGKASRFQVCTSFWLHDWGSCPTTSEWPQEEPQGRGLDLNALGGIEVESLPVSEQERARPGRPGTGQQGQDMYGSIANRSQGPSPAKWPSSGEGCLREGRWQTG